MNILDIFQPASSPVQILPPYVIAEAGVNHEGNMDIAKRLVEEAAEGGADAIKFQTYKAEKLASKDSPAYWDTTREPTQSQYELFKKHDSFWKNEFEELKKYCDKVGIAFLSTPFDIESAAFLSDLMEVFKISSSDITNMPFINYLCEFKKPIILSTGAAWLHEIVEAVEWIEARGNRLALLHCVLNYPTKDGNAALGMIPALKRIFPDHAIGYSDHTLPGDLGNLVTATLLGATIIEKHFTHDKTLPGNDHYHAMDMRDLKTFYDKIRKVLATVGPLKVYALPDEEPARKNARRSLISSRNIKKGEIITGADLTWKRPGNGISPRNFHEVVGLAAHRDIPEDSVLLWQDFEMPRK